LQNANGDDVLRTLDYKNQMEWECVPDSVNPLSVNAPGNLEIKKVTETLFLSENQVTTDELWMTVNENDKMLFSWVAIKPPNHSI